MYLTVYQSQAIGLHACYRRYKCSFTGIRHLAEHAFAKKHLSKPHSVKATHQSVVLPGLVAVGMAHEVQIVVAFYYSLGDPGAMLTRSLCIGAALYHLAKSLILSNLETLFS